MQRWASGVLEWVADGVANNGGRVGIAPLTEDLPLCILEPARLDELLRVIPCAARVVQHRGEQHAADRSNDQQTGNRLGTEQHSN